MATPLAELGQNTEIDENSSGETIIRNTQTGTEIRLADFVDVVGPLGDSSNPVAGTSHFESVNTEYSYTKLGEMRAQFDPENRALGKSSPCDSLNSLSDWTVEEGSATTTTSNVYRGSNSVDLTLSGNRAARLSKTFASTDFSNLRWSIAVKDISNSLDRIQLRFFDSVGGYQQLRAHNPSETASADGSWMRVDFGYPTEPTGIDFTDIVEMKVLVKGAGGTSGNTVLIDDIRYIPNNHENGAVIIEIDNPENDDGVSQPILDVMEEERVHGVMALDGKELDLASSFTGDVASDYADKGWGVTSKPLKELDSVPIDEVESIVKDNKERLLSKGLKPSGLTYSANNWSETILQRVKKYHTMAFSTGRGMSGDVLTYPLVGPRNNIEGKFGAGNEAFDQLDKAAEYGYVAHHYCHTRNVSESEIRDYCQHIKSLCPDLQVWTTDRLVESQWR